MFREIEKDIFKKIYVRKRPGTVGICAAIQYKYKVDAVPHLICGGFTKDESEDALIDLNYLGIENVLVLRGDPAKDEKSFKPEKGGHPYAIGLVEQVMKMNRGEYLNPDLKSALSTDFEVGVAGYPEKHNEAPNMATDLRHLKAKVDAGAKSITTQMFFDNDKYFKFVENCREAGIDVPIIPGLKPITRRSQVKSIPRTFSVDIPDDLTDAIENCKDDKAAMQVGKEWIIEQTKGLIKGGAPIIHYYTMGKVNNMIDIAKSSF